jgi:hypothetical protein
LQRADSEEHCGPFHPKGPLVSISAEDSRKILPRFPLDLPDSDAAPQRAAPGRWRRRPRLELVVESSETNVPAAPATHDLFNDSDDECGVALTHVYVPVTFDPPRDPESRRRLDAFWTAPPRAVPEPPAVYRPLFPRVPLLQRPAFLVALSVGAVAALALWIGIAALLWTSSPSSADVEQPAAEGETTTTAR